MNLLKDNNLESSFHRFEGRIRYARRCLEGPDAMVYDFDLQEADWSSEIIIPIGWVSSSRTLEEELIIETSDTAILLTIRPHTDST